MDMAKCSVVCCGETSVHYGCIFAPLVILPVSVTAKTSSQKFLKTNWLKKGGGLEHERANSWARECFDHELSHADDSPFADVEHRECVDKGPEAPGAFRQFQVPGDTPHFENSFLAGGVTLEIEPSTGPWAGRDQAGYFKERWPELSQIAGRRSVGHESLHAA
jgi:hypothetical protein